MAGIHKFELFPSKLTSSLFIGQRLRLIIFDKNINTSLKMPFVVSPDPIRGQLFSVPAALRNMPTRILCRNNCSTRTLPTSCTWPTHKNSRPPSCRAKQMLARLIRQMDEGKQQMIRRNLGRHTHKRYWARSHRKKSLDRKGRVEKRKRKANITLMADFGHLIFVPNLPLTSSDSQSLYLLANPLPRPIALHPSLASPHHTVTMIANKN